MSSPNSIVELVCANGHTIHTTTATIQRAGPGSPLSTDPESTSNSDINLIKILIDALRRGDLSVIVPEGFDQWSRLASEAKRLGLTSVLESVCPSTITVACHAALATGRINQEVTFRKVLRIVVSGKVIMCRNVFGDSLNECRDGGGTDFEMDRFFLKHNILEKAFDQLAASGYRLVQSNTFAPSSHPAKINSDDSQQFLHHSQYIFHRTPKLTPIDA